MSQSAMLIQANIPGVDWLAMRNQEIFFSHGLDRRVYGLDG